MQSTAVSLNAIADAQNAIERIKEIFLADLQSEDSRRIDPELPVALRVEHGSFEWELPCKPPTKSDTPARLTGRVTRAWNKALKVAKEKGRELKKTAKRAAYLPGRRSEKDKVARDSPPQEHTAPLPTNDEKKFLRREREVFKLYDINLEVPRGQLCAIVGPVGAGKSSLVQGIIGGRTLQLRSRSILTNSPQRCERLAEK